MNIKDKNNFLFFIPSFLTIFAWLGTHAASYAYSSLYNVHYVSFKYVLIPIILQLLYLMASLKYKYFVKKHYKTLDFIIIFFHITYVSLYTMAVVPKEYNVVGFTLGFMVSSLITTSILSFSKTVLIYVCYFLVGAICLWLRNYPLSDLPLNMVPFLIGTWIIFPTMNYHISLLKKNLNKKKKEIDEKNKILLIDKITMEEIMEQIWDQKKSRDLLLENLTQGFLTFDQLGIINEGATKITETLLEAPLLESEMIELKIWDVLFTEENDKKTFEKWVEKVFEGKFLFKDLKELAPKTFQGTQNKFIKLDFRPIFEEDSKFKVNKVIMIASDKTQVKKLKEQLEADKENIKFINTCLQSPLEFVDLINDTFDLLQDYPQIKGQNTEHIFRTFHTLKARFAQFGLKKIAQGINLIETAISNQDLESLDSKVKQFDHDFKNFIKQNRPIVEAANKFLVDEGNAIQVSELLAKGEEFTTKDGLLLYFRKKYLLSDIKQKFERYQPLVDELSQKQGKSIDMKISGDPILVDYSQFSDFVNTSIHLLRNMVDHGIETEDERIEKTKPQRGSITLHFQKKDAFFTLEFKDDGQGIEVEKVKKTVLEKGLKTENDLKNLTEDSLLDLIFLPGLSTKTEVTEISGRGIGLNAVRSEIERLGGKIKVESKVDEGTTFTIWLPLTPMR